jgi:lactoylglutathione lyase
MAVLRKIDCVMVRVPDLMRASEFYTRAFGLRQLWADEASIGMGLTETDAEIVLHTMDLPADENVYYLVDDVDAAASQYDGAIRKPPFDIAVGRCAILEDPFGNTVGILDLSKGLRPKGP